VWPEGKRKISLPSDVMPIIRARVHRPRPRADSEFRWPRKACPARVRFDIDPAAFPFLVGEVESLAADGCGAAFA